MAASVKWKPARGKTWRAKLEEQHPNHGKIVPTPPRMRTRFGSGTMLIPNPREVDRIIRTVRKGRLITVSQLRGLLARCAGADSACPLTTGILTRIVAETAEEDRRAGKKRITPWWRTIRDDGSLHEKLPGGPAAQARRLRDEGIEVRQAGRGRRGVVVDFEKRLVR